MKLSKDERILLLNSDMAAQGLSLGMGLAKMEFGLYFLGGFWFVLSIVIGGWRLFH